MILSALTDADRFTAPVPSYAAALAFLRRPDLAALPPGRVDIDGDHLYGLVQRGPGRKPAAAQLEAHDRYIDIQYVIAGEDNMGWSPREACHTMVAPFDAARDIVFFADAPESWIKVTPGRLVIFYPWDAHLPSISDGVIHKVVIKVQQADWSL